LLDEERKKGNLINKRVGRKYDVCTSRSDANISSRPLGMHYGLHLAALVSNGTSAALVANWIDRVHRLVLAADA